MRKQDKYHSSLTPGAGFHPLRQGRFFLWLAWCSYNSNVGFEGSRVQGFKSLFSYAFHWNPRPLDSLNPIHKTPITYRQSNASGATSVSDSYFYTFDDHRNFSNTIRISEHFLQSCLVQFNIEILSFLSKSRPGLVGEWSAGLAINNNFFTHTVSSSIVQSHNDHYSNFRIQGVKVYGSEVTERSSSMRLSFGTWSCTR